jgi:plastocyanin
VRWRSRTAFTAAAAVGMLLLGAGAALAAEVQLTDEGFEPDEVTVEAGDTIVWTNASDDTHTIVGEDGRWDSGPLAPGETFSLSLRAEGTYGYETQDGAHTGTIVVVAELDDDPEPEEEPEEEPVTPRTGLPALSLGLLGFSLVTAGAALLARAR